jgi:hypothetical protein
MPRRQLPPGLVITNLRPVLELAGPADAAGALIIFGYKSGNPVLFLELALSWRISSRPLRCRPTNPAGSYLVLLFISQDL